MSQPVIIEIDPDEVLPRMLWRELVYRRDGCICQHCDKACVRSGASREDRIEAHHVNGDGDDHRLANGISLCRRCHQVQTAANLTPEQISKRQERVAEAIRARSPEARSATMRKAWVTRKANGDTGHFGQRTPEERSAQMRKAWETRRARAAS